MSYLARRVSISAEKIRTMSASLFFGVGAGRCGTMGLANILDSEPAVTCLHEGKFRRGEAPGEKVLPFLTLQNGQAYHRPEMADGIFHRYRGDMATRAPKSSRFWFGDVAYNYAPFLPSIARIFPAAKIIVMFRNGADFVQSAAALRGADETPIGWPPRDKTLNDVEKFVALGRWRPRPGSKWADAWDDWDHFERNTWLWSETNRVILDALEELDPAVVHILRFESFFESPERTYPAVRAFLGLPDKMSPVTLACLRGRPINRRTDRTAPPPSQWSPAQRVAFDAIAGGVMRRLGYDT